MSEIKITNSNKNPKLKILEHTNTRNCKTKETLDHQFSKDRKKSKLNKNKRKENTGFRN